jgi:ribosomal protein L32
MRHTRSHTKNRRSHHALVGMSIVTDKETGTLSLPHRIDEATGIYRGKQIVAVKEKKAKKGEAKMKGPRTEAAHEHKHEKGEHEHENAAQTRPRGFFGRVMNARPQARSGAGGGGSGK